MQLASGAERGNMRFWLKLFAAAGALLPSVADTQAATALCLGTPGIMIQGDISIDFSDTERYLVCGEKTSEEPFRSAWKNVPSSQARFFIRRFLENRGFYHPRFESDEAGGVIVFPGEITRAAEVILENAPEQLDYQRHRKIIGRPLTPELLDELEQWIKNRLQSIGYPCPRLATTADPSTGKIKIRVNAGEARSFDGILMEPVPGIHDHALRRFDAFQFSDPFNADLLRLTAERTVIEGTLLSTYFDAICSPSSAGATARQSIVPGLPHILRFGFGANTEGLVLARTSWRNTRLGTAGSLFDVSLFASTKEQRIDASFNWYFNHDSPRAYIEPSIQLRHQNEDPFEALTVRMQVAPGTTWDGRTSGIRIEGGPAWDFIKTLRGVGPEATRLLSLEARAWIETHYFEFHKSSPRAGAFSRLTATFNDERFLSDVTAQRLNWDGQALLNWRNYFPPLLIGGVRWSLRTTITNEELTQASLLPSSFRQFLGGIADVRGFGRNELPSSELGALSLAYAGFELRLCDQFPIALEPLAFVDLGLLGRRSFSLDTPLYWSPGVGLRWETPFGAIRATLARGYLTSDEEASVGSKHRLSNWQFYFSFGEEF